MTAWKGERAGGLLPLAAAVIVAVSAFASTGGGPARAGTAAPSCAQIAAAEPQAGHTMPPAAPALFAPDFPVLDDCEWGYRLGGFGGISRGYPLTHTPVIFVHGNQADAENWFLVADEFKARAAYTNQELWAVSYNGLENGYAGLPTCCAPAPESTAYWQSTSPPYDAFCCNGGHGASDDPNVPDVYAFVRAVQAYTGSQQIDIVAHSLGVTIVRKMLYDHPELRPDVLSAVMIAGANHGTTVCRGLSNSYYGCDEIAPGTAWLTQLNSAGEAPGPTHWMSVYNGADNTDPFFEAYPGLFDDTQSPHLAGADDNISCPKTYHNDLRVRPDIVQMYLDFLLATGQSTATAAPPSLQVPSTCTIVDQGLGAALPESPLAALLLLPTAALAAAIAQRRRRRPAS
ncbi:MAG: alpha/beta hydrolase family protein [Candidatus Dormibacteria bacterium]